MKKKHWEYVKIALVLILFAIVVPLSTHLSQYRVLYFPTNLDRPIGMQLFSEMIGEVRTILASYIYIRADMYHHEREEKINWRKDPVTLPLYRLITTLDPKMDKAYDFGAYHLAVNFKKYNEGIKFLREGLRYNPKSYILHFTMGDIFYMKGEYETSIKYFLEALDLARNDVDVRNCLRRLYWANRKIGRYDESLKYLKMWSKMAPKDPVLPHLYKELYELKAGKKTEKDFEKQKDNKKIRDTLEKELEENIHHHHHKHHHHHHH